MASTSSMHTLPNELIHQIFRHLDNFTDLLALSSVSRVLYATWKLHARSICSAVMPRSILCFRDATALINVQQQQDRHQEEENRYQQQQTSISGDTYFFESPINLATRLHLNARIVSMACDFFEADTHPRWPKRSMGCLRPQDHQALIITHLSHTERIRFTQAYYRIWTLALSPLPAVRDSLAATDLRELLRLRDLGWQWIRINLSEEKRSLLRIREGQWIPFLDELDRVYYEKQERITGTPGWVYPYVEDAPLGIFSVLDQFQEDYVDSVPEIV